MKGPIVIICAALMLGLSAGAQQPEPAKPGQAKPRVSKLSLMDTVKLYVQKAGASADETKSTADMVVSNLPDARSAKLTIVIVNDRRKSLLGFYIYNFGNLKDAPGRDEVSKYLLAANDLITIGSFFVDNEQDIGYKYLISTQQPLAQAVFDSIYFTMAAVARERRAEIKRLLGQAPIR